MNRFVLPAGLVLLFAVAAIVLPLQGAPEVRASRLPARGPAWEARLNALELENAALRDAVADLQARVATGPGARVSMLEQYPVPSGVTLCGERLPLERADVRARFEEEWTRVLVNEHWAIKWLRRSRDVFPYVEARLAAAGLPDDLKYILVVESGLESRAYSSAGAAGWWQFISSTGKHFGLDQTNLVDERRDLGLATTAAMEYLSGLHEEFGSWPLALSAYNAGERRVRDELQEQGEDDFYDLSLPRETEAYWFKAAVIKVIFESPARYGFALPEDGWAATVCDTLQLQVSRNRMPLHEIAHAARISTREFRELNPAFRKSWLPRGSYRVILPHESVEGLLAALEGVTLDAQQRGEPVWTAAGVATTPADEGDEDLVDVAEPDEAAAGSAQER